MHNCLNIDWSDVEGSTLRLDDFLTINVSGMKYETLKATLERFPKSLLGAENKRCIHFVPSKNAYFFNRCRQSFEAILYYYQSGGILTRPPNVPLNTFEEEVKFYQLGVEALSQVYENEGLRLSDRKEENTEPKLSSHSLQQRVWDFVEYPDSSTAARWFSFLSMFVICVSIIIFCVETLPVFRSRSKPQLKTNSSSVHLHLLIDHDQLLINRKAKYWFSTFEMACVIWFTVEYLVRFLSSPKKSKFVLSVLNLIDVLAIVPYFVVLAMRTRSNATPLSVLRIVRLVRTFRVFKLSRHSMSLQILGNTLRASVRELGMLIFFLLLGVILFSSGLYYAELGSVEHQTGKQVFLSIPDLFWYCLVTMTTVGYGDKVPLTRVGKMIGGVCALTGVLALALPVPVIVSNFQFFYKRDQLLHSRKSRK